MTSEQVYQTYMAVCDYYSEILGQPILHSKGFALAEWKYGAALAVYRYPNGELAMASWQLGTPYRDSADMLLSDGASVMSSLVKILFYQPIYPEQSIQDYIKAHFYHQPIEYMR